MDTTAAQSTVDADTTRSSVCNTLFTRAEETCDACGTWLKDAATSCGGMFSGCSFPSSCAGELPKCGSCTNCDVCNCDCEDFTDCSSCNDGCTDFGQTRCGAVASTVKAILIFIAMLIYLSVHHLFVCICGEFVWDSVYLDQLGCFHYLKDIPSESQDLAENYKTTFSTYKLFLSAITGSVLFFSPFADYEYDEAKDIHTIHKVAVAFGLFFQLVAVGLVNAEGENEKTGYLIASFFKYTLDWLCVAAAMLIENVESETPYVLLAGSLYYASIDRLEDHCDENKMFHLSFNFASVMMSSLLDDHFVIHIVLIIYQAGITFIHFQRLVWSRNENNDNNNDKNNDSSKYMDGWQKRSDFTHGLVYIFGVIALFVVSIDKNDDDSWSDMEFTWSSIKRRGKPNKALCCYAFFVYAMWFAVTKASDKLNAHPSPTKINVFNPENDLRKKDHVRMKNKKNILWKTGIITEIITQKDTKDTTIKVDGETYDEIAPIVAYRFLLLRILFHILQNVIVMIFSSLSGLGSILLELVWMILFHVPCLPKYYNFARRVIKWYEKFPEERGSWKRDDFAHKADGHLGCIHGLVKGCQVLMIVVSLGLPNNEYILLNITLALAMACNVVLLAFEGKFYDEEQGRYIGIDMLWWRMAAEFLMMLLVFFHYIDISAMDSPSNLDWILFGINLLTLSMVILEAYLYDCNSYLMVGMLHYDVWLFISVDSTFQLIVSIIIGWEVDSNGLSNFGFLSTAIVMLLQFVGSVYLLDLKDKFEDGGDRKYAEKTISYSFYYCMITFFLNAICFVIVWSKLENDMNSVGPYMAAKLLYTAFGCYLLVHNTRETYTNQSAERKLKDDAYMRPNDILATMTEWISRNQVTIEDPTTTATTTTEDLRGAEIIDTATTV